MEINGHTWLDSGCPIANPWDTIIFSGTVKLNQKQWLTIQNCGCRVFIKGIVTVTPAPDLIVL